MRKFRVKYDIHNKQNWTNVIAKDEAEAHNIVFEILLKEVWSGDIEPPEIIEIKEV